MNDKNAVKKHFDDIASDYDSWKVKNSYYYTLIKDFFRRHIPPGSKVIEFGCATGEILASCKPKRGLGVDLSFNLVKAARSKYPQYQFVVSDVEKFTCFKKFDYCIMSDLIDHLSNIPQAIESAYELLSPKGELVITTINPLWNPVFGLLERLKLKMPEGPHCFIPNRYIEFFCKTKGFEIIKKGALIFFPKNLPIISDFLNRIVPEMPILYRLCWVQTLIVRKDIGIKEKFSCSVIVPAYNEEDNIEECIMRINKVGCDYEIVVVDDGSSDKTFEIAFRLRRDLPNLKVVKLEINMGKAKAVERGIKESCNEVIVILDADMSVAPEDLPLFIEPLERKAADFVNGTRLVYDMKKTAMSQIRRIGNFVFAALLSLITKMNITDTLCGTKAFFKRDLKDVKFSGERWGDFVLLIAARNKKLRIGEVPVRYFPRKSGYSKMRPFQHGCIMIWYVLSMWFKRR